MALIHINADGTFEAVANAIVNRRAQVKARLDAAKLAVKTLTADARVAAALQTLNDKLAAARKVIAHGKSQGIKGTTQRTYVRAVQERHSLADKIAKTKAKLSTVRHAKPEVVAKKLKSAKAELEKVQSYIKTHNIRPANLRKAAPAVKKAVTRKVSFDTEARRAARETTQGIKGKLRELDAKSKQPTKKKPAKSTTKHAGSVKTGAKATVLASIKQIKADIAKGLTGPKLARAQAELKKQRAALRELRKGESAANKAAVQPRQKASKAGMGSSKTRAGTGGRTPAQQNKKTTLARKKAIGK